MANNINNVRQSAQRGAALCLHQRLLSWQADHNYYWSEKMREHVNGFICLCFTCLSETCAPPPGASAPGERGASAPRRPPREEGEALPAPEERVARFSRPAGSCPPSRGSSLEPARLSARPAARSRRQSPLPRRPPPLAPARAHLRFRRAPLSAALALPRGCHPKPRLATLPSAPARLRRQPWLRRARSASLAALPLSSFQATSLATLALRPALCKASQALGCQPRAASGSRAGNFAGCLGSAASLALQALAAESRWASLRSGEQAFSRAEQRARPPHAPRAPLSLPASSPLPRARRAAALLAARWSARRQRPWPRRAPSLLPSPPATSAPRAKPSLALWARASRSTSKPGGARPRARAAAARKKAASSGGGASEAALIARLWLWRRGKQQGLRLSFSHLRRPRRRAPGRPAPGAAPPPPPPPPRALLPGRPLRRAPSAAPPGSPSAAPSAAPPLAPSSPSPAPRPAKAPGGRGGGARGGACERRRCFPQRAWPSWQGGEKAALWGRPQASAERRQALPPLGPRRARRGSDCGVERGSPELRAGRRASPSSRGSRRLGRRRAGGGQPARREPRQLASPGSRRLSSPGAAAGQEEAWPPSSAAAPVGPGAKGARAAERRARAAAPAAFSSRAALGSLEAARCLARLLAAPRPS